ncbi:MAG: 5-formyltetrahydrofolate cyclo-ligase [Crocinitomicaceae bacterium]|nr:5-formyltetrahydrofolate cyclo-ligase [Crocinitomicaceae bacterium]
MKKAEARKIFKEERLALSPDEREKRSQQILDNLVGLTDLSGKKVSIFLPIERLQEINTWKIIEHVNAQFILPVVQKNELKHILFESEEQLRVSDWGIPEPQYGKEIDPTELDFVLVPLLAVDMAGNRVGYGAGFYDNFLKSCSPECTFIGLSYFEPVEYIQDFHQNDIPLHFCVSPNSVYKF